MLIVCFIELNLSYLPSDSYIHSARACTDVNTDQKDDDMVFDRHLFSIEQFLWLAQNQDAVISAPKIIRVMRQTDEALLKRRSEVGKKMTPRGVVTEEVVGDKV